MDKENKGFYRVFNEWEKLGLPPAELLLLAKIYSYDKNGGYWGSNSHLFKSINIKKSTFYNIKNSLQLKGFIYESEECLKVDLEAINEAIDSPNIGQIVQNMDTQSLNIGQNSPDIRLKIPDFGQNSPEYGHNNRLNNKNNNITKRGDIMTEQKTPPPPPFEKVLFSFNQYYQTSLQLTPHNIKIAEQISEACKSIKMVDVLFYYTSQKQTLKNRDFGEIAGILKKDPSLLDEAIEFCKKAWDNIVKQKREQERAEQAKLEKQKRDQPITEESKNYRRWRFFVEDVLKKQNRFKVLAPASQAPIITEIMEALPQTATEEEVLEYYLKNCLNRKEE